MEVILEHWVLIAALVAMTVSFRIFHDRARHKKLWLICDLLVHMVLVGFLLYEGAGMEELLLVLLVTLAIGLA